jgi:hypothetical protein
MPEIFVNLPQDRFPWRLLALIEKAESTTRRGIKTLQKKFKIV